MGLLWIRLVGVSLREGHRAGNFLTLRLRSLALYKGVRERHFLILLVAAGDTARSI